MDIPLTPTWCYSSKVEYCCSLSLSFLRLLEHKIPRGGTLESRYLTGLKQLKQLPSYTNHAKTSWKPFGSIWPIKAWSNQPENSIIRISGSYFSNALKWVTAKNRLKRVTHEIAHRVPIHRLAIFTSSVSVDTHLKLNFRKSWCFRQRVP